MLGYLIVTDWQTIPYDPCTEFSPYHHPGITQDFNISSSVKSSRILRAVLAPPKLTSINLNSDINIELGTSTLSFEADLGLSFSCRQTMACDCSQFPTRCLKFLMDNETMRSFGTSIDQALYQCSSNFNQKSPITFCIFLSGTIKEKYARIKETTEFPKVEINSISVLPEKVHETAQNICTQANVSGHQCHWIPNSDIFKKECEDCQPICRSVRQTLTFPQYIIGNGVLVLSSALQVVPVTALLMNQSPELIQVTVHTTNLPVAVYYVYVCVCTPVCVGACMCVYLFMLEVFKLELNTCMYTVHMVGV